MSLPPDAAAADPAPPPASPPAPEHGGSRLSLRLAAGLLALAVLLGIALVAILRTVSVTYQDEVIQRSNAELARTIASEARTIGPDVLDVRSIAELFPYVTMVNPIVEAYVLDRDGRVLAYSGATTRLARDRVELAPLRAFIERSRPMPIRAVDPRSGDGDAIFSAAALGDAAQPLGYVYVVLGRSEAEAAAMRSSRGYAATATLALLVAALMFAVVAGTLLFRSLTAPLQLLAADVDRFRAGGFRVPPPPRPQRADDEIARLARAFDEMARRIVEQLERLQAIDDGRRTAVLNASHDLRTPLAALQGYLQTLLVRHDSLGEAQRTEYLQIAHRHAQRLNRLVDQMFELAKLDAPETAPRAEVFSAGELVGDIGQKYSLHAQDRGITLSIDVGPDVPPLRADIAMVERLVENLVENALKYTPAGGSVTVCARGDGDAVELLVADTGQGIAPEEHALIFERFYRSGGTDRGPSSGLGLAIVRRIAELHGATVRVDSAPGKGSRFTVRFPGHVPGHLRGQLPGAAHPGPGMR